MLEISIDSGERRLIDEILTLVRRELEKKSPEARQYFLLEMSKFLKGELETLKGKRA
jgi:hypothetical protein